MKHARFDNASYCRFFRPTLDTPTARNPCTDFIICEESQEVKRLVKPYVKISSSVFMLDNIALVVVIFLIGSYRDKPFEVWFNFYHETHDMVGYFSELAGQKDIGFHFYDKDPVIIEKTIIVNNPLQDFFKKAIKIVHKLSPWSMDQFDQAKKNIYPQFKEWLSQFMQT